MPLIAFAVSLAIAKAHPQTEGQANGFDPTFLVACILTGMTLFLLGAWKSRLTGHHWIKSGSMVLFTGGLAAAAAYLIGFALKPLASSQ